MVAESEDTRVLPKRRPIMRHTMLKMRSQELVAEISILPNVSWLMDQ